MPVSHRNIDGSVEAELARLATLGLDDLRHLWGRRIGAVPKHHSPDMLRRRLAWELQARIYGGLRPETRRKLQRLHVSFKTNGTYNPSSTVALRPGIVLSREWQGTMHRVSVLEQGFGYRGERFGSLSQIARQITGTRWSGPLFFGLKTAARET